MALVFQELTFRVAESRMDLRVLGPELLCRGAWWSGMALPECQGGTRRANLIFSGPLFLHLKKEQFIFEGLLQAVSLRTCGVEAGGGGGVGDEQ